MRSWSTGVGLEFYHRLSNRPFGGAANLDFLHRLHEKPIYVSLTKHCPLCIVIIILIGELLNLRESVSHKKIIIYFFLMFPDFLILSAMHSLFQIWPALINIMNSCLFSLAPNSFKRKLQGKNNLFLFKNSIGLYLLFQFLIFFSYSGIGVR